MLPMTFRTEDPYQPGFRFLTGFHGLPLVARGYGQAMQAAELHTVTARDGEFVHTVDDAGVTHQHIKRPGQELEVAKIEMHRPRMVIWNLALPDLPADAIRIMADALKNYHRPPPLLLLCIEAIEQGMLCERVMSAPQDHIFCDSTVDEVEPCENAFFAKERILLANNCDRNEELSSIITTRRSHPTISPAVGDLLIAINPTFTAQESPAFITDTHLFRLASNMDREAVGSALPENRKKHERDFGRQELMFADLDDVMDGIGRGQARTEPNDLIVVAVPHLDKDERTLAAVSHRGIRLYDSDNLNDDLWGTDLEAGVWIGEDVTWFDCGEDGAEWEAAWRRATPDDLASYGIDSSEILEYWNDLDLTPSTLEEITAMVEEARGPNSVEARAHG